MSLVDTVTARLYEAITSDPQYLLMQPAGGWTGPDIHVFYGAFEDNEQLVEIKPLPLAIARHGVWREPLPTRRPSIVEDDPLAPSYRERRWIIQTAFATLAVAGEYLPPTWPIGDMTRYSTTVGLAVFRPTNPPPRLDTTMKST